MLSKLIFSPLQRRRIAADTFSPSFSVKMASFVHAMPLLKIGDSGETENACCWPKVFLDDGRIPWQTGVA